MSEFIYGVVSIEDDLCEKLFGIRNDEVKGRKGTRGRHEMDAEGAAVGGLQGGWVRK